MFSAAAFRHFVAGFLLLSTFVSGAGAQETESWLGLPVTYKSRSYAFTPWPAIEVRDLKIATATPILINKAFITPDWGDWITEFKTQRVRVHAGQVTATPDALLRLSFIDGRSSRKVTVLSFEGLNLIVGGMSLPLPKGEMEFAPDGTLAHLKVGLDQGLKLDISPNGGKLVVLLQASSWRWAGMPLFLWESLVLQGELTSDALTFDKIGGNSDGGAVRGLLRFAFTEKLVELTGELKLDNLRTQSMIERVFPRHTVQGTLSGNFKLSAQGATATDLASSTAVSGTYTIKNGAIDRFGLQEGMRKGGGGAAGGGLTSFETLTGSIKGQAGQGWQVVVQRLDKGAMQGSGSINVASDSKLKGYFSGSMRLPGGETNSRSFTVTGEVGSPTLMIAN